METTISRSREGENIEQHMGPILKEGQTYVARLATEKCRGAALPHTYLVITRDYNRSP